MNADAALFLALKHALEGPLLTPFFSAITRLGDGFVLAAIILPALFYFDRERFKHHALPLILSVALSGLLVNALKIAVDRPRPPEYFAAQGLTVETPLGTPPDRSFPSGHSQTAWAAATYLSCLYPQAAPFFLLTALFVGLSRISLGVHFPLDVAVGAGFGAIFSAGGFLYAKRKEKWREENRRG